MSIEWRDEFCVGMEDIDAQHKYFFQLIDKVEKASRSCHRDDQLADVLQELQRYGRYHFGCEERLMEVYGYPDLQQHRSNHRRLLVRLSAHIQELASGHMNVPRLKLFLFNWFARHTTLDDQEYAAHIKGLRNSGTV